MRNEIFFLGWAVVFLSSAWKNVGMPVTCNRCDVMNSMWCETQLKWQRRVTEKGEEMGGGGGRRREQAREKEREHAELWNTDSRKKKDRKNGGGGGGGEGGGGDSTLEKGKRLLVPNIWGDEWANCPLWQRIQTNPEAGELDQISLAAREIKSWWQWIRTNPNGGGK